MERYIEIVRKERKEGDPAFVTKDMQELRKRAKAHTAKMKRERKAFEKTKQNADFDLSAAILSRKRTINPDGPLGRAFAEEKRRKKEK